MKHGSRRIICAFSVATGLVMLSVGAIAQTETTPVAPKPMTVTGAKEFLTAAGLQTCEISEMEPFVAQFQGAIRSFSIAVAKDCSTYDPADPTVINVYQFDDVERRDAMVASLRDLRYRALRPYASVWAVDNFIVVVLGPRRQEIEAMVKAEYLRRHPGPD